MHRPLISPSCSAPRNSSPGLEEGAPTTWSSSRPTPPVVISCKHETRNRLSHETHGPLSYQFPDTNSTSLTWSSVVLAAEYEGKKVSLSLEDADENEAWSTAVRLASHLSARVLGTNWLSRADHLLHRLQQHLYPWTFVVLSSRILGSPHHGHYRPCVSLPPKSAINPFSDPALQSRCHRHRRWRRNRCWRRRQRRCPRRHLRRVLHPDERVRARRRCRLRPGRPLPVKYPPGTFYEAPGYTPYGPLDILLCIVPVPGTGLLFLSTFFILPILGGELFYDDVRCALSRGWLGLFIFGSIDDSFSLGRGRIHAEQLVGAIQCLHTPHTRINCSSEFFNVHVFLIYTFDLPRISVAVSRCDSRAGALSSTVMSAATESWHTV